MNIRPLQLFYHPECLLAQNFRPFVRALMPLLSKHKDLKVVCTGAGFDRDEQAFFIQCGVSDRMLHLSASSDVLYNLYHNASAFVFPSSYEGFGLPILESFACACPAILNRASCFPEIAGDAALWFDMLPDSDNLTEVLDDFLTNRDSIAPGLVSKGLDRLRMFSWKESAARLASVYRSCL